MSYDVIVIGAGSAGCVVAARLSEDPSCEVLLLEAGPDYTRDQLPADVSDATRLPSDRSGRHDWGFVSAPGDRGVPSVTLPRGWLVGGSSAVNGTFALRGFPEDYDAWQAAGNEGWAFSDVLDGFRDLETDLDLADRPWHGGHGPVPVRRYPPDEQGVLARAFLEAAHEAGHPPVDDHNEPDAVGVGPLPVNALDGVRMSASLTHLEPARSRPNLTVRGHAHVDRIEIVGDQARGVRMVGGERIAGDRVVLSAGAYLSPTVLLRSGIGDADDLAAVGIDPAVHLPGVGRNLADHVVCSVDVAVPAEPVQRPNYQSMLTWRSDGTDGPPDLHLFACGPFQTDRTGDSRRLAPIIVGLVDPASRGQVRLAAPDPAAPPHIDLGYLTEPHDLDRLVVGVREARRILDTGPLSSPSRDAELSPGGETTDEAHLRARLPHLVRTYHHPVGTCRMGPDPDDGAVVDARAQLHGVDGLVVADASIMPRIPRANTNLPTLMLAERIARWLATTTSVAQRVWAPGPSRQEAPI